MSGHTDNDHQRSGPHYVPLVTECVREGETINIPPKSLSVVWGNDRRYWKWVKPREPESTTEVVELQQVNWIEVTGKLDCLHLKPSTKYEVYWIVKFREDAFGWHSAPITFEAGITDTCKDERTENLEPYSKEVDKWHEIQGGEFRTPLHGCGSTVEFGMYEVSTAWWKGSMVLRGVKLKPK